MREFATLPQDDRADALVVAARGKGMHPAIVEKDFWVCWTLDYLGICAQGLLCFQGRNEPLEGFRSHRALLRGY